MSRLNKILLVTLFYLVFTLLIILPSLSVYPAVTDWGAGIDYGRQYIVVNGVISPVGTNGTWQGLLSNYGSQDVASKIEFSVITIVAGTSSSEAAIRLLNTFVFSKLILMPLFGILVFDWIAKGTRPDHKNLALIGLFAMMPLASVLPTSQTSGVAGNLIAMALMMPIIILMASGDKVGKKLILFLLIYVFLLLWHTWSLYFLIMCIALFMGSLIDGNRRLRATTSYCIIAYLAIGTYLNFDQLISTPNSILTVVLNLENVQLALSSTSDQIAYRTGGSLYSIIQMLSSALIIGAIAYAVIRILHTTHAKHRTIQEQTILWMSVGLVLCWFALFMLGGITTLVARVLEPSIPLSIFAFSYLLVKRDIGLLAKSADRPRRRARRRVDRIVMGNCILPLLLMILIFNCALSHLASPVTPTDLHGQEPYMFGFVDASCAKDADYYSDFRLGAPLILYDIHNVYTIDKNGQDPGLFLGLISIYYNETDPEAPLSELVRNDSYYVLTSGEQSVVGIADPNQNLLPAMAEFEANFRFNHAYSSLYTNGDANVWLHTP